MERRKFKANWYGKIIIFLILSTSCHAQNKLDMTREANEILNPQLVDLIREYALTNIDYSVYPNFLYLLKTSINDTTAYRLRYASNLHDVVEPNISYILRLDNFYIAMRDTLNADQLTMDMISKFLKSEVPGMYKYFKIYNKRLKRKDVSAELVLSNWLTGEDIWILKFKDGKLISKDITK